MKKSEMLELANKFNIDLSDLFEGRGRGRLPLDLIEEAKNRLTEAGWDPTVERPKVLRETEATPKCVEKVEEPVLPSLPANFQQKEFSPGQTLNRHSYGHGKLSKTKVKFLRWNGPGKARVEINGRETEVCQSSLHEVKV